MEKAQPPQQTPLQPPECCLRRGCVSLIGCRAALGREWNLSEGRLLTPAAAAAATATRKRASEGSPFSTLVGALAAAARESVRATMPSSLVASSLSRSQVGSVARCVHRNNLARARSLCAEASTLRLQDLVAQAVCIGESTPMTPPHRPTDQSPTPHIHTHSHGVEGGQPN